MLGVGESEVAVTQYQNNSYAIDVFTDSPGGWKATITAGNDWLKLKVELMRHQALRMMIPNSN